MQVVKIKLYQNMVNYRREMSFGYVQTYPLPTPSMVRGMVHSLLGLKSYHPLSISIQGSYETSVMNMQRIFKFDRDPKARPGNPYHVTVGESSKTATHGVMFVDCLVNVELILHIAFEDESLNSKLLDAIQKQTVTLGRNEDIARIDDVILTEISDEDIDDDIPISNPIWMNIESAQNKDITGTFYRIPFCYAPVSTFEDKRLFKFVHALYVSQGSTSSGTRMKDSEGDWVELLRP